MVSCIAVAFLLQLNGTSHEFLHTFTGHEDTVDCAHNDHPDGPSFEQQHHHCDFLDLQAPVFLGTSLYFNFFTPIYHDDYFVVNKLQAVTPNLGHTALRGPPAA